MIEFVLEIHLWYQFSSFGQGRQASSLLAVSQIQALVIAS
jgi:hypothetical protein